MRLEIRNQIKSSHTKPLSICIFGQGSFVISYSRSGLSLRDAAPDWLGQEQWWILPLCCVSRWAVCKWAEYPQRRTVLACRSASHHLSPSHQSLSWELEETKRRTHHILTLLEKPGHTSCCLECDNCYSASLKWSTSLEQLETMYSKTSYYLFLL